MFLLKRPTSVKLVGGVMSLGPKPFCRKISGLLSVNYNHVVRSKSLLRLSVDQMSVGKMAFNRKTWNQRVDHNHGAGNPNLKGRMGTIELLELVVQISCFLNCKKYFSYYKTSYFNKEVNCTKASLSARLPCVGLKCCFDL